MTFWLNVFMFNVVFHNFRKEQEFFYIKEVKKK